MNRLALVLPALLFSLATWSTAASARDSNVLLVSMGGYDSCKGEFASQDGIRQRLQTLRSELLASPGLAINFVATCFSGGGLSSPEILSVQSTTEPSARTATIDELPQLIGATADALGTDVAIYVVGHSHGGWLAMHTALHLDARYRIAGLTTIDPISFMDCTPHLFASGILGTGAPYPGCTTVVPDLAPQFFELQQRVGTWQHFYQVQDILLHSNSIPYAAVNQHVIVSGTLPRPGDFHSALKLSAEVWLELRDFITGAVNN